MGLFCSTRSGVGLFCRFQLKLQQFCVKPFVGHANLIRCRYWRLEERRDRAVSRVVSVFFYAVYIVLLGQCYVAMPSGYKLVITRALGLHGIYCTQPSGLAPSCFSAIYSIHPSCPCYNYNLIWYTLNSPSGGGQGQISMPLCGYPLCTLHHFVGQTITCTVRAYASFSLHTIYMYIYYNYIDHNIIMKVLRVLMPRLRC